VFPGDGVVGVGGSGRREALKRAAVALGLATALSARVSVSSGVISRTMIKLRSARGSAAVEWRMLRAKVSRLTLRGSEPLGLVKYDSLRSTGLDGARDIRPAIQELWLLSAGMT